MKKEEKMHLKKGIMIVEIQGEYSWGGKIEKKYQQKKKNEENILMSLLFMQ